MFLLFFHTNDSQSPLAAHEKKAPASVVIPETVSARRTKKATSPLAPLATVCDLGPVMQAPAIKAAAVEMIHLRCTAVYCYDWTSVRAGAPACH